MHIVFDGYDLGWFWSAVVFVIPVVVGYVLGMIAMTKALRAMGR